MRYLYIIFISILFLVSCSMPVITRITDENEDDPINPVPWEDEVFEAANKPAFEEIDDESDSSTSPLMSSYLLKPWNYEKDYNGTRTYPLVIYLHGSGAYTSIPSLLTFLGYNNEDFMSEYPSFVLAPRFTAQWYNGYPELAGKIENIISKYRIDTSRIYVIGYSMGSHWAVPFLNYYYQNNGRIAAALISQTGISNVEPIENAIKNKMSIWIQIGDEDSYLSNSTSVYNSLYPYYENSGAVGGNEAVDIPGYTDSLTQKHSLNGIIVLKNTIYAGASHGITHMPFGDPEVMNWLFSQDTEKR